MSNQLVVVTSDDAESEFMKSVSTSTYRALPGLGGNNFWDDNGEYDGPKKKGKRGRKGGSSEVSEDKSYITYAKVQRLIKENGDEEGLSTHIGKYVLSLVTKCLVYL